MAGRRGAMEEMRNQMMQNLFGEQSDDGEEVYEDASEQESAVHQSGHPCEEGEDEIEFDGEGAVEGQEEDEVETEEEAHVIDPDHAEIEKGCEKMVVTGRRLELNRSESDKSGDNYYKIHEDEGVDETRKARLSSDHKDYEVVRDVFGDSDGNEPVEDVQNKPEQYSYISPIEVESCYGKNLRPKDVVPDEDSGYKSEDEYLLQKQKEKSFGSPLDLEVPLCRPPGQPDRMNMIKVSNIMGIEPKPFDPKTYVEESVFVTDESGAKKRIQLEDNIVRWRRVKNHEGTISYESNARFVKWEDGSLQLLIGNEILDISVQEAEQDQTHLFLRHGKGILQSQGRLLKKMRFMPSSLSSKSHRLLTSLVDARHKKTYKVKNCITVTDPEREKEEKEKEPMQRRKETGSSAFKGREIDSDRDSSLRKAINRRKAITYDSDED